ncbi:MAG: PadR family transcriptional regulator [Acidimicrobiales bacterium]
MSRVKLEFILLGALLQRPQTGYELQRFMETTGRFLRVNTSMTQVYRSLRSMDDAGWLAHRVEPRRAQDAKRYSVTEAGAQAFGDWLGEPYEPGRSPGGEEFVVQLRFRAEFLGCEAVIQLLDVELEFWEQHKARYRHRDRTELYSADAPIDVDCVGAIHWEHLRGGPSSTPISRHCGSCGAFSQLATGRHLSYRILSSWSLQQSTTQGRVPSADLVEFANVACVCR